MKVKLKKQQKKEMYLYSTSVENLFINELLPIAPGDYVKIYLFALMYAEADTELTTSKMAQLLGVSTETIERAWDFWEKKGVIERVYDDGDGEEDYEILFIRQMESFYSKKSEREVVRNSSRMEDVPEEEKLINNVLRGLFTEYEEAKGNAISRSEMEKISSEINEFSISPDVFSYAIRYCNEKDKFNINYISKVAQHWKENGCENIVEVKELLDRSSKRNSFYKRVFAELGFNRVTTPGDREMMDRWFDEMKMSLEEVLSACRLTAGQRDPSLKYVNKVLENKVLQRGGIRTAAPSNTSGEEKAKVSTRVLEEYLMELRDKEDKERTERREKVFAKDRELKQIFDMNEEIKRKIIAQSSNMMTEERETLKGKKRRYDEMIRERLVSDGYTENYLDIQRKCDICGDTGDTDDGRKCVCLKTRADEAYKWNIERNR